MKAKFTVLIAVFNAAPWLEECLNSLSGQTEGSFQAICIDDCSTDESLKILKRRAAADPRFEVMRTPVNSGQAVARNLGLERARGELTLFLDADDTLAPDALALLWQAYSDSPETDAVVMRLVQTWPDGSTTEWPSPVPGKSTLTGREACLLSIDWRLHGIYAIRTDIHRRLPYSTLLRQYSDDNTTRLHYLNCRCVALSNATYYYRQHPASCTHVFDLRRTDFLEANRQLRKMIEDSALGRKGVRRCEMFCWYNLVGLYREMYVNRAHLSADSWAEACRRFAAAFAAIRPWRLSPAAFRHPSTVYVWPFALFRLWQLFVWRVARLFRRAQAGTGTPCA